MHTRGAQLHFSKIKTFSDTFSESVKKFGRMEVFIVQEQNTRKMDRRTIYTRNTVKDALLELLEDLLAVKVMALWVYVVKGSAVNPSSGR